MEAINIYEAEKLDGYKEMLSGNTIMPYFRLVWRRSRSPFETANYYVKPSLRSKSEHISSSSNSSHLAYASWNVTSHPLCCTKERWSWCCTTTSDQRRIPISKVQVNFSQAVSFF